MPQTQQESVQEEESDSEEEEVSAVQSQKVSDDEVSKKKAAPVKEKSPPQKKITIGKTRTFNESESTRRPTRNTSKAPEEVAAKRQKTEMAPASVTPAKS